MNAGRRTRRLVEELQRAGKIDIRIGGHQARDRRIANRLSDQDCAGFGLLHLGRVGWIGEKSELAGDGVLHSGHTDDLDLSVAHQFTAKL